MRRFTECLILSAVLAACDSATDPAGPALAGPDRAAAPSLAVLPEHFTARESFDSDDEVNPCNGEPIHLTGEIQVEVNLVHPDAEDPGVIHGESQSTFVATGVGDVTGTVYLFRKVLHTDFESPSASASQVIISERDRTHGISLGSAGDYLLHFTFVFVGLPSGEGKVAVSFEGAECLGKPTAA
jgi:hypothetical protein